MNHELATLVTAFLMGLSGSLHCVGMCAGIAGALEMTRKSEDPVSPVYFHAGRVLTYCLLGLVFSLPVTFIQPEYSSLPRILAGAMMLLLALYLAGLNNWIKQSEKLGLPLWQKVSPLVKKLLPIDSPVKAIACGALWGLIPCGLVYAAVILAAAQTSLYMPILVMLLFGAGTVPALFLAARIVPLIQSTSFRYTSALLLIVMGGWTIYGGLMDHSGNLTGAGHDHHHHH